MKKTDEFRPFPGWEIVFTPEEYQEIKESIKKEGIKEPIIVIEIGSIPLILDGHHRWLASKELSFSQIPYRTFNSYPELFKIVLLSSVKDLKRIFKKIRKILGRFK